MDDQFKRKTDVSHFKDKDIANQISAHSLVQTEAVSQARERILSQDYVSLIYRSETFPFLPEEIPVDFLPQAVDWQYTILNAPLSVYPPDIAVQGYFTIPKLLTPLEDSSLEVSGILTVRNQPYLQLQGEGVILGFLDTGIDYRNPAFRKTDGTTRILSIWDQTLRTGAPPEGFLYGAEFTDQQINEALQLPDPQELVPSFDEIGHGTALAGIAAGSENGTGCGSGAAPQSDLIVVKLKPAKQYLRDYFLVSEDAVVFQEDDCMLAVRYLQEAARKRNRPLVICIGLGTNQGGHDGYTPLEEVLTYLSNSAGNYVSVAAGNEAGRGHHFLGQVQAEQAAAEAEIVVEESSRGFSLELWAYAPELFALRVVSPLGERTALSEPRLGAEQTTTFLLDRSVVSIDQEIVEFRSGSQLIQVRVQNPSPGIWRIQVENRRFLNGIFHLWLPISGVAPPDVRFLNPEPDTTLTIPACSTGAVTVSAYQPYNNSLYLNASRGFTRNGLQKPDLAAPGVDISVPYQTGACRSFTGTSAAAALTAGAIALLVQWGLKGPPQKLLSSTEIKNLLYRGAGRIPEYTYPNREWGYGTLDVYGIFRSLTEF